MDLSPISRRIAFAALRLNGSRIVWFKAMMCPGQRDDGTPCFDEESGSSDINCTTCNGRGSIYRKGEAVYGVYSDNSNNYSADPSGGFMMGMKTLSLPYYLPISLLKERGGEGNFGRRFLRDRFVLLNSQGKPIETLYLEDNPTHPLIGGETIYLIAPVSTNFGGIV